MDPFPMTVTREQVVNLLELFQDWQCDNGYLAVRADDSFETFARAFLEQQDLNHQDHVAAYGA